MQEWNQDNKKDRNQKQEKKQTQGRKHRTK